MYLCTQYTCRVVVEVHWQKFLSLVDWQTRKNKKPRCDRRLSVKQLLTPNLNIDNSFSSFTHTVSHLLLQKSISFY